jgi:hypothetical protein
VKPSRKNKKKRKRGMQRTKIARLVAEPREGELTTTPATSTSPSTDRVWYTPRVLSADMMTLIGSWLTPTEITDFLVRSTRTMMPGALDLKRHSAKYALLQKEWAPAIKSARKNVWTVTTKPPFFGIDKTFLLCDVERILLQMMRDECGINPKDIVVTPPWPFNNEIPTRCVLRWLKEFTDDDITEKVNDELNLMRKTLSHQEKPVKDFVRHISLYADPKSQSLTITVDYTDEEMDEIEAEYASDEELY